MVDRLNRVWHVHKYLIFFNYNLSKYNCHEYQSHNVILNAFADYRN